MNKLVDLGLELLESDREVDGQSHKHFELLDASGIVASCYVEGWGRLGGYLMRVHVAPARRNGGLGTELVRAVIRAAMAEGKPALGLSVKPDNAYALQLYQRLGFRIYYQHDGKDGDYLMTLDLTGEVPGEVQANLQQLRQAISGGQPDA